MVGDISIPILRSNGGSRVWSCKCVGKLVVVKAGDKRTGSIRTSTLGKIMHITWRPTTKASLGPVQSKPAGILVYMGNSGVYPKIPRAVLPRDCSTWLCLP